MNVARLAKLVVLVAAAAVAVKQATRPILAGDGREYFAMLESFANHFTPEQRLEDVTSLEATFAAHGLTLEHARNGFFLDWDGRWYCYHFWTYSLAALPAKLLLRLFGGDPFGALAWTNGALFVATAAYTLLGRGASTRHAVLFAATAVSPVLWYLRWPHTEVFSWACVTSSLVAADRGRLPFAAALAALGSTQAPPIAVLAALHVLFAALPREGRWRRLVPTAAGASIVLAPPLFYLAHFHAPNLILAGGMAHASLATPGRALSLILDPNHGLALWMPVPLALGVLGLVHAARTRDVRPAAFVVAAGAMLLLGVQSTNLNAGCAGVARYLVWVAPVLAWAGASALPEHVANLSRGHLASFAALGAGVLGQAWGIARTPGLDDAHEHHRLARALLEDAPSLYVSEPTAFVERTTGRSTFETWQALPLPVGYARPDGVVTKLLADGDTLRATSALYDVDPMWLEGEAQRRRGARGLFWIEPPAGAVRRRDADLFDTVVLEGFGVRETAGAERWRWMAERGAIELDVARDVPRVLRIHGGPHPLPTPTRLAIRVDDGPVEELESNHLRRSRFVVLPAVSGATEPRRTRVELRVSQVWDEPGTGRRLGFSLRSLELLPVSYSLGAPYARFVGPWGDRFQHAEEETRCAGASGEVTIDPIPGVDRATLLVNGWVPAVEIGGPSRMKITIDGRVADESAVFFVFGRMFRHLSAREPHTVRFEVDRTAPRDGFDTGVCLAALRYVPDP